MDICRRDIYGNRWLRSLGHQRGEKEMSDTHLQIGAGVAALILLAASYLIGTAVATQATIKEAQRSAVIAGAARWSSNRETGEAEFNFIQCLNPGVK